MPLNLETEENPYLLLAASVANVIPQGSNNSIFSSGHLNPACISSSSRNSASSPLSGFPAVVSRNSYSNRHRRNSSISCSSISMDRRKHNNNNNSCSSISSSNLTTSNYNVSFISSNTNLYPHDWVNNNGSLLENSSSPRSQSYHNISQAQIVETMSSLDGLSNVFFGRRIFGLSGLRSLATVYHGVSSWYGLGNSSYSYLI